MNCEVFQLHELEVEHFEIREVLRCILHTIMFHRALGLVSPKDVDSKLFEVTYVQCNDTDLEKKIEERIDHFVSWVEKHPNKKGQVCLSFFETMNKQTSWFSKVEHIYWERWFISLSVIPPKNLQNKPHHGRALTVDSAEMAMEERTKHHATLEAALRDALFQVLQFVNEKKDHIPPVTNTTSIVSSPFKITIPSSSDSSFGMDMFKRMLQTGPPTMLS